MTPIESASVFPKPPQAEKSTFNRAFFLQAVAGGIAGALCIVLARQFATISAQGVSGAELALLLGGLFLGVVPTVIIHELGHAFMGWLSGMRFVSLAIGSMQFVQSSDGRIRRESLRGSRAFAGFALFVPPPNFPPVRLMLFCLGGPIFNLLQAALCMLLATLLHSYLAAFVVGVGTVALMIGIVNLLPFSFGGMQTDGRQILDVLQGGEAVRLRMEMMTTISHSVSGRPPWSLDRSQFKAFYQGLSMPSRHVFRLYDFAAARYEARHADAEHEIRTLAQLYDSMPKGFRESVALQIMIHLALSDQGDEAALWRDTAAGGVVSASERAIAEAALAYAQRDQQMARLALERARTALAQCFDKGWAEFLRWQLDDLQRRLETLS
jgi:hypothetical protein